MLLVITVVTFINPAAEVKALQYDGTECILYEVEVCNICGGDYTNIKSCIHREGEEYGGEECTTYTMTVCNICGEDYSNAAVCPHKSGTSYGGTTCVPYSGMLCNLCNAAYSGWYCPHIDGQYSYEDAETCEIYSGSICNICGGNYNDASSCTHKNGTAYGGTTCSPYTMTCCSICDEDYTDASVCPHKIGQIYNVKVCSPTVELYCNICDIPYYGSTCPHIKSDYLIEYGNFTTKSMDIDMSNQLIIDAFEEYGQFIEVVDVKVGDNFEKHIVDYNSETLQDIINRANIFVYGTKFLDAYPVSRKMLEHYLGNTGEAYTISFATMNKKWKFAGENEEIQINELLEAAEVFDRDTWIINQSKYDNNRNKEEYFKDINDWKFAVHAYSTHIKAYVQKQDNDSYHANIFYYMDDCYDWDKSDPELFLGLVSPHELWSLHSAGVARAYQVKGAIEMEISWNKGDRYNEGVKIISYK